MYRTFQAFDAKTGRKLWETNLDGPVEGYPISFAVSGKQYIAVTSGGASVGQRHLSQLFSELKAPTGPNTLIVFSID